MKVVPFINGRYTKGSPILSEMVYIRVKGWTSGGASPYKTLLSMVYQAGLKCMLQTVLPFPGYEALLLYLISFR